MSGGLHCCKAGARRRYHFRAFWLVEILLDVEAYLADGAIPPDKGHQGQAAIALHPFVLLPCLHDPGHCFNAYMHSGHTQVVPLVQPSRPVSTLAVLPCLVELTLVHVCLHTL